MTGQERDWVALGDRQEVSGHRLDKAEERMEAAYTYAVKSQTHLWFMTMSHQATEQTLDVFDGGPGTPLLDADTLLMRPTAGCYVCEQSYDPRLRRRRCPGEPNGGGRR